MFDAAGVLALLQFGDPASHGKLPLGPLDGDQQLLGLERLDQVVVGAAIDQPHGVVDVAEGGDEDHERRESFRRLDLFEQDDAIHGRHADVADDQLERVSGKGGEGFLAVAGGRHCIAPLAEDVAKKVAHLLLVVDDENAQWLLIGHWATSWRRAGKVMTNRAPPPGRSSTRIFP